MPLVSTFHFWWFKPLSELIFLVIFGALQYSVIFVISQLNLSWTISSSVSKPITSHPHHTYAAQVLCFTTTSFLCTILHFSGKAELKWVWDFSKSSCILLLALNSVVTNRVLIWILILYYLRSHHSLLISLH